MAAFADMIGETVEKVFFTVTMLVCGVLHGNAELVAPISHKPFLAILVEPQAEQMFCFYNDNR